MLGGSGQGKPFDQGSSNPRHRCGGRASPCAWPRPRPSGFWEFAVGVARATFMRRTLQVRRGGHYICIERATFDPITRVTAAGLEDWFFEAVQRMGGTGTCFAGPLAFEVHLISPVAVCWCGNSADCVLPCCFSSAQKCYDGSASDLSGSRPAERTHIRCRVWSE